MALLAKELVSQGCLEMRPMAPAWLVRLLVLMATMVVWEEQVEMEAGPEAPQVVAAVAADYQVPAAVPVMQLVAVR